MYGGSPPGYIEGLGAYKEERWHVEKGHVESVYIFFTVHDLQPFGIRKVCVLYSCACGLCFFH